MKNVDLSTAMTFRSIYEKLNDELCEIYSGKAKANQKDLNALLLKIDSRISVLLEDYKNGYIDLVTFQIHLLLLCIDSNITETKDINILFNYLLK